LHYLATGAYLLKNCSISGIFTMTKKFMILYVLGLLDVSRLSPIKTREMIVFFWKFAN
jgi:hypothetical protein